MKERRQNSMGILYDENIIDCYVQENIFKTLLKVNGELCELIFEKNDDFLRIVDSRLEMDYGFIMAEKNSPLKYYGDHKLCAEIFETNRYYLALKNLN